MIIDAHVHISLYNDNAKTLEDALGKLLSDMSKNGVKYAIVIPDDLENQSDIADINMAEKLISGHSNLFLLGSPQIIQRGTSEVSKYEDYFKSGGIKGIKFFPGHDPYYPTDKRCDPYYQIAEKYNAPVVFHTGINPGKPEISRYNDPKYIVEVAKKYPKLKVVITHYFWPKMEYCYKLTRSIPNIYFELAGVGDPEVVEASGGVEKVKSILAQTISDRPQQVIFGTDWPMCQIENHINLVKSLNLPSKTARQIFFDNAVKTYNLPLFVSL